ncbi:MAG: hypothetical protein FJ297_12970 [Planctomycetes bacterium]|nr:hypothetical protein [Planctomycetota bacterium]
MARRRRRSSGEGCANWIATCIATIVLLWINVGIARGAYQVISAALGIGEVSRLEQAVVLSVPAVLLFVQWWLWELASDRFHSKERTLAPRRIELNGPSDEPHRTGTGARDLFSS